MSDAAPLVALRRTITPYVGLTLIFLGVSVFAVWVGATTSQWSILWVPAILWPLAAYAYLYFGLKYRIFRDEAGVVMRAPGIPERRIQFDAIGDIRYEIGGIDTILAQSRPFRRIVILPRGHAGKDWIDVSLRHFQPEDIEALLQAIRTRRPDLQVPRIPEIERAYAKRARRN